MSYSDFASRFHAHFTRCANERVFLGVETGLGELPDPSETEALSRLADARALLSQIDAVRAENGDDFHRNLDLDLASMRLEGEIHEFTRTFNGRTRRAQLPHAGDDIGDGMFALFINDPRSEGDRLENIADRMEAVPGYLAAARASIDTPVTRWAAIDDEKVEGLPHMFATLANWAQEVKWADTPRLLRAREAAESSLVQYRDWLAAQPTSDNLHVGREAAAQIIKMRGIDLSIDELHGIARDFLARTRGQIEELGAKLAAKYELGDVSVEDVEKHLNERYKVQVSGGDTSKVLERYREERSRIRAFIEERDLFPIFAGEDLAILQTPKFMEPSIPAGAMVPPPPFREGTRRSLVYLTLSEALMDEHTDLSIPSMMIHEGIPGHHLHLATAGIHKSVIRRHCEAMDQAEGWTTMLEDYMLDVGYMGDLTDEARFVGKRDISRLGARVAIDLFFMTGERDLLDVGVKADVAQADPFEAAGSLLAAVTGFVPGRVKAELNWYSQERGYPLSYLTGNHLVWALKREVAKAQEGQLGGLELDRRFHATYLHAGNMPVRYLRRVYEHVGLLPSPS
jgi:uncharacterized protein (DUF885 family)